MLGMGQDVFSGMALITQQLKNIYYNNINIKIKIKAVI